MAAFFDNVDDVHGKFVDTICYYDKKAVVVKNAQVDPDKPGKYILAVYGLGGRGKLISLHDPLFSYKPFNLGYMNNEEVAVYWYRRPLKQYRQGLKADQMHSSTSHKNFYHDHGFSFNKACVAMLENTYPSLDECKAVVDDGAKVSCAFHKDFALSWDKIHHDFVIEYRGQQIGNLHRDDRSNILKEFSHLSEAFQEAIAC